MTNAFQFHSASEASAVIGPQDIWAKRIEDAFSVTAGAADVSAADAAPEVTSV